jgi:hypothetical protein
MAEHDINTESLRYRDLPALVHVMSLIADYEHRHRGSRWKENEDDIQQAFAELMEEDKFAPPHFEAMANDDALSALTPARIDMILDGQADDSSAPGIDGPVVRIVIELCRIFRRWEGFARMRRLHGSTADIAYNDERPPESVPEAWTESDQPWDASAETEALMLDADEGDRHFVEWMVARNSRAFTSKQTACGKALRTEMEAVLRQNWCSVCREALAARLRIAGVGDCRYLERMTDVLSGIFPKKQDLAAKWGVGPGEVTNFRTRHIEPLVCAVLERSDTREMELV